MVAFTGYRMAYIHIYSIYSIHLHGFHPVLAVSFPRLNDPVLTPTVYR